jgi:FAD/FMN-containing dehydrogenase
MSILEAINILRQISNDLVVLPEAQAYNEITNSYFTELERELKPACFLVPKSPEEVASILKAVKPFAEGLKIAICGAGQQATPEVANVHDGLTIHLRNLQGVEINVEKSMVSIAAGEKMGNVYEKVMAAGFGVVGNRHSSGGIGGDAVQGDYNVPLLRANSKFLRRIVLLLL